MANDVPTTFVYGDVTYDLTTKSGSFVHQMRTAKHDDDQIFSAMQVAIASGLMPKSALKLHVPDYTELVAPVITRALARNKTVKRDVAAYFAAIKALNESLAAAGLGDGYGFDGIYSGHTRFSKPGDGDVLRTIVHVKNGSPTADAGEAVQKAKQAVEKDMFAIARRVALKNGHEKDAPLKMRIEIAGPKDVTVTFGRTSSGGGGGGGKRSKYDVSTDDAGEHTVKLIVKDGDDVVLATGSTKKQLLDALKVSLPANNVNYYASQWTRQAWFPTD